MQHGHDATNRRVRHQQVVRVERADGHRSLAQMQQALRKADHEQMVWLLAVVRRQVAQQASDARVVRSRSYQTEGEYSAL